MTLSGNGRAAFAVTHNRGCGSLLPGNKGRLWGGANSALCSAVRGDNDVIAERRHRRAAFNITGLEPRIVMPQLSSRFFRLPALAMVLLGLCAKAPPASAEPLVLKAGIAGRYEQRPCLVDGRCRRLLRRAGAEGRIHPRLATATAGIKDLQAGRIDIMHRGLSNIVNVNRSGGDLRLIGCLGDKVRFVFFSAPGVNSSADLKGGVVAISHFGSEGDSAATLALNQLGLTRDDVTIKEVSPSLRAMAAVQSGEVKAAMLSEPFTSLARAQGIHVLIDLDA